MTSMQAAALWVGLNLLLLIVLSLRVGQARLKTKVMLGDGANDEMLRAIRTQGNYIEYAPAALIGIFLLAALGAAPIVIHAFGAVFLIARIAHFLGLGLNAWPQGRAVGAVLTLLSLLAIAGFLLAFAFS